MSVTTDQSAAVGTASVTLSASALVPTIAWLYPSMPQAVQLSMAGIVISVLHAAYNMYLARLSSTPAAPTK